MIVVAGMSDKLALDEVAAHARRVEALGVDALHVPETVHDSLLVALLALEHTTTLRVRTSVTLAFPRSPMVLALAARDLTTLSGGRFDLGLGTQIRQNIEGRYSVPWTDPVGRLGDYVAALRAIWTSFGSGAGLRHDGPHYRFDRLQPFFDPGPVLPAPPAIWLGGVNRGVVELAGSVADGFVTHPTNSHPRYLVELCLPGLDTGAQRAGRPRPPVIASPPIITAPDEAGLAEARAHQRRLLAFLWSTPAYGRTLELFGWSDLGPELRRLTRERAWDRLVTVLGDEVLDTLVPQATWADLPGVLSDWYGGLADGVLVRPPADPTLDEDFAGLVAELASV